MSHEIRTPMNAVLGLTQLLEKETLSADQLDIVSRISSDGRSLLNIINDILDYSKIAYSSESCHPIGAARRGRFIFTLSR